MTLTEFLKARIDEDDAVAREALSRDPLGDDRRFYTDLGPHRDGRGLWTFHVPPDRVLAECEAKRQIVAGFRFEDSDESAVDEWMAHESVRPPAAIQNLIVVAKALALPYADHPDYQPEWNTPDTGVA